ncbi:hypothetical protein K0M31_006947 [Melipona bicolor]|uniref:Uncharacterized protein n=1 Tax=Melipona bicolor TaxID=60889 RepID=A0AA40FS53_9HYME|nr:hypothetical protein K0M31_006947 [Melipona bicolor]
MVLNQTEINEEVDLETISTLRQRGRADEILDRDMLLPSKLVCHRVRLSQPALMSKIVSVNGVQFGEKNRTEEERREGRGGNKTSPPPLTRLLQKEERGNNYQRGREEAESSRMFASLVELRDDGNERYKFARVEHVRRDTDSAGTERDSGTYTGTEMKIPFAVRYIKLVVECFESYHSHFDELGPQNRSSREHVRVRCTSGT